MEPSRTAIEKFGFGIADESGWVQKAVKAQNVAFRDLNPQLAADTFDGGLAMLANARRAEMLQDECERFRTRLEKGMTLVIVNPPAGWAWSGIERRESVRGTSGAVRWAAGWGQALPGSDVGEGPWPAFLRCDKGGKALAQVHLREDTTGPASRPEEEPEALILACPVGRGKVIVALMPQLQNPEDDAVGRHLLNEIVVWSIQKASQAEAGTENGK
jgi:hypothetical protein